MFQAGAGAGLMVAGGLLGAGAASRRKRQMEAIANMDLRNKLAKSKFEDNIEDILKEIGATMDKEFEALGGK